MLLTMLSPYFQDIGVFAAGTTPTASGSKNDKKPEIPSGSVDFPDHIVSAVEPPEGLLSMYLTIGLQVRMIVMLQIPQIELTLA